jgi:hypothetical protein
MTMPKSLPEQIWSAICQINKGEQKKIELFNGTKVYAVGDTIIRVDIKPITVNLELNRQLDEASA